MPAKEALIRGSSWPLGALSALVLAKAPDKSTFGPVRTLIDTPIRTHHAARVAAKEKRTYNLPAATVRVVRELADEYHAAPTQDAVVELAVSELARKLRDEKEASAWKAAGTDPAFTGEALEIEDAYRGADRETWPA